MNMPSPSISTSNSLKLKKDVEFEKNLKSTIENVSTVSELLTPIAFAARYIKVDTPNPLGFQGKSLVSTPWLPVSASALSLTIEVASLGLRARSIREKYNTAEKLNADIKDIEQERIDEKIPEEKEYREKELKILKFIHNMINEKENQEIFYFCTGVIKAFGKMVQCIPIPEAWGLRMVFWAVASILEILLYKAPCWCLNHFREKASKDYEDIRNQLSGNNFKNEGLENEIYKRRYILYKLFDTEKSPKNQSEKRKENAKFILELIESFPVLEQKGVDVKEKEEKVIMYVKSYIDDETILHDLYEFINYVKLNLGDKTNARFKNVKASLINAL